MRSTESKETGLNVKGRLDICETLYGKMEHVVGVFYRSIDRCHFVNIMTGEDLLADSNFNAQHIKDEWSVHGETRRIIKIGKRGIIWCLSELVPSKREEIVCIIGFDGEIRAKIAKNLSGPQIKEIRTKEYTLYMLGRRTSEKLCVVIMNNKDFSLKEVKFNVDRVFEYSKTIDLITIKDGKILKESYQVV